MIRIENIERSQRRLYKSLQNELLLLEKGKTKELKNYEKNYSKLFQKPFKVSSRKLLMRSIAKSKFIFVADFHPFNQSQKTFLRIVREARSVDENIIIALECIQSQFQKQLDNYLQAKISLEELREEIEFSEHWPFSWKNYGEILSYAREHRIKVLALNKTIPAALQERDHHAATVLANAQSDLSDPRIFILFGELHLAPANLPKELAKLSKKQSLLIFQNEPTLYWKISRKINQQAVEVLQLAKNQYCVMNAVPWVKLQSYLDWFEGNAEEDDFENADLDLSASIRQKSDMLSEALGIKTPTLQEFDMHGIDSIPYLQSLVRKKLISPVETQALKYAIRCQRLLTLPARRIVYLPNVSSNSSAEAAALILYYSLSNKRVESTLPKQNMSAIIRQHCLAYLGSKVINPKRKCNEEEDIENFLKNNKKRSQPWAFRKQSFVWAVKELDWLFGRRKKRFTPDRSFHESHGLEAARVVGYILGDRLFTAVQDNADLLQRTIELFLISPRSPSGEDRILRELSQKLPKRGPSIRAKNQKL